MEYDNNKFDRDISADGKKPRSRFMKASDSDLGGPDADIYTPAPAPAPAPAPETPPIVLEVMPDARDTSAEYTEPADPAEAPSDGARVKLSNEEKKRQKQLQREAKKAKEMELAEKLENDPIRSFTNYKKQKRKKRNRVLILIIIILILALLLVGGLLALKYFGVIGENKPEETTSEKKETEENYFEWTFEEGVLTVSGRGTMPDYEGEYVPWKAHRQDIVHVVIEDGITNVGNCSFRYCENLVTVSLPDGVTRIGDRSFTDCDSIESITLPDSVTNIGAWAFDKCDSLTKVNLPESLTTLGTGAFNECGSLESIKIPENIRDIGQDAFNNCDRLTEVDIPAGVKYVGIYAFYCKDLEDIYFGGTMEEWSEFDRPHNPEYTTVHCSDGEI
ncbi:MAG: leucine-rich repeat domain-containing protein [Clostridia bacterium]|nr:leucine-rich repeat domain-containing protein [Clostridia bacterium]